MHDCWFQGPPGDFGPKGIRGPKGPQGTMVNKSVQNCTEEMSLNPLVNVCCFSPSGQRWSHWSYGNHWSNWKCSMYCAGDKLYIFSCVIFQQKNLCTISLQGPRGEKGNRGETVSSYYIYSFALCLS